MEYKSSSRNIILCTCLLLGVLKTADGFDSIFRHVKPRSSPEDQAVAAINVIQRLIPVRANSFTVFVNESIGPTDRDTFQVLKSDADKVVTIIGTSAVAVTSGFHHYLKYYCLCQVSWDSDQLALPDSLPTVNISITSSDRFRYYQNVCTTSYSFAWWDWKRWEREIDWMALNGFNMALAFTAQEAIWKNVYQKLNLTNSEIQEHFGGPAFLAWSRMGNLRGWGGPLTDYWHEQTLGLQRRILARMRDLGIAPILPAFAGHVPRAFKRLYPEANMTLMSRWVNFNDEYCCPYMLEPTDDLFRTIGNMFTSEIIAAFGTDHLYNCDTFNEMTPSNGTTAYLSQVGQAIYRGMADVDPHAIWVLQNWMFVNEFFFWNTKRIEAFLTSVPLGRMIVLDLQSEQHPKYELTKSYFGQPFIWCMLHNFGGTLGLFGSAEIINNEIFKARSMENSTMIGTGLTPEGINQNYVIYDLMNDMAWRSEPYNLTSWFLEYPVRRYGAHNLHAERSWQLLKSSVYNFTGLQKIRGKYIFCRHPSLKLKPLLWYDVSDMVTAWDEMLAASESLKQSPNYQHDLVDVTRQAMQLLAAGYYIIIVKAFKQNELHKFQTNADLFLDSLSDVDDILASNKDFLLGTWLNAAKAKGTTPLERKVYEFNARNQITLWGPNGEIQDYAIKQWSGMVKHYFLPRWQMYLSALNDSLITGTPFDEAVTRNKIFREVEEPFTLDNTEFPAVPQGDSIELALKLHQKWRNENRAWKAVERFRRQQIPANKTAKIRDNYQLMKLVELIVSYP